MRPATGQEDQWRLHLLEAWQLWRGNTPVPVSHRAQRLIALVALRGNRSRSVLAADLWPDSSEIRALGNLRATLWQIRHSLPGLLSPAADPIVLDAGVYVDVRDLLGRLRHIDADGEPDLMAATDALLDCGDLLPGWYDDWVLYERERLQHQRLQGLEMLAERLTLAGDLKRAMAAAEAAAAIEPLRESASRSVINVHLAMGNRIDALRVYDGFRRRTLHEFGVPPSEQIAAMVRPLLLERSQHLARES